MTTVFVSSDLNAQQINAFKWEEDLKCNQLPSLSPGKWLIRQRFRKDCPVCICIQFLFNNVLVEIRKRIQTTTNGYH